jgi:hypothetical protein
MQSRQRRKLAEDAWEFRKELDELRLFREDLWWSERYNNGFGAISFPDSEDSNDQGDEERELECDDDAAGKEDRGETGYVLHSTNPNTSPVANSGVTQNVIGKFERGREKLEASAREANATEPAESSTSEADAELPVELFNSKEHAKKPLQSTGMTLAFRPKGPAA